MNPNTEPPPPQQNDPPIFPNHSPLLSPEPPSGGTPSHHFSQATPRLPPPNYLPNSFPTQLSEPPGGSFLWLRHPPPFAYIRYPTTPPPNSRSDAAHPSSVLLSLSALIFLSVLSRASSLSYRKLITSTTTNTSIPTEKDRAEYQQFHPIAL